MCRDEGAAVFTQYMFGTMALPTNYIIGRDGKVIYRKSGFFEEEEMYAICDSLCSGINSSSWGEIKSGFLH